MDFDAWQADLAAGTATHANGYVLRVEGNFSDPSNVEPLFCPDGISVIDQAGLLRAGLAFLAKAGKAQNTRAATKSAALVALEAQAKQFAERCDKPHRPLLTRKKSN